MDTSKATPIGAYQSHGKTMHVKPCSTGRDFFAYIEGESRVRFGNTDQIREDIAYFQLMSCFPPATYNGC